MEIIITGRKVVLKDSFKDLAEKKVGKIAKYFKENAKAHVTVSVGRSLQTVELTITAPGGLILHAQNAQTEMETALDNVVSAIIRQIHKNKTKLSKGRHISLSDIPVEDGLGIMDEPVYTIAKSKKFAIKPMDVDEAILQMNMLDHNFFMFTNSATGSVSVVYKRAAGDYGLIEPEPAE